MENGKSAKGIKSFSNIREKEIDIYCISFPACTSQRRTLLQNVFLSTDISFLISKFLFNNVKKKAKDQVELPP